MQVGRGFQVWRAHHKGRVAWYKEQQAELPPQLCRGIAKLLSLPTITVHMLCALDLVNAGDHEEHDAHRLYLKEFASSQVREKDGNQTYLQINREFQIFLYVKHVTGEAHLACVLKEALLIGRWGCFSCIWRKGNVSNTVQTTTVRLEHGSLEKPRTNEFREHREGWRAVRRSWEEGPCSSLLYRGPTDSASASNVSMGSTFLIHLMCQAYGYGSLLSTGSIENAQLCSFLFVLSFLLLPLF